MTTETMTIEDRLNQCIKRIKILQTLERNRIDQEQKKKNKEKYLNLVLQATQISNTVHYAQATFAFPYQSQEDLFGLLNGLRSAALSGTVDDDFLSSCFRTLKTLQDQVKNAWENYYPSLVGSVRNTLQIIQRIEPDQAGKCLADIQNAKVWQNNGSDIKNLRALSSALGRADSIIARLGLDEEITAFLGKVSKNTATINDLSDGIMDWIRKEKLTDRIMVSFR